MTTAVQKTTTNATTKTATHKDIYQQVTDIIIEQLEAGTVPWQQPWKGGGQNLLTIPKNFTTGNHYRGINIVLLWGSVLKHDYPTNEWASYKQWQEKKEAVRAKEKGSLIVYYDTFEKEVDGELQKMPFIKTSYVFNRSQLVSYEPEAPKEDVLNIYDFTTRIEAVEQFIDNTGAIIENHGDRAFYRPSEDKIVMPPTESFFNTDTCTATEAYYSTILHELTHWSGHEKRMNRTKGKRFGDENYANEELVAEFGAAMLCASLGIATVDKGSHAGYIENWLKALKDNKKCLFTAASEASKAMDYLYGLQPTPS